MLQNILLFWGIEISTLSRPALGSIGASRVPLRSLLDLSIF